MSSSTKPVEKLIRLPSISLGRFFLSRSCGCRWRRNNFGQLAAVFLIGLGSYSARNLKAILCEYVGCMTAASGVIGNSDDRAVPGNPRQAPFEIANLHVQIYGKSSDVLDFIWSADVDNQNLIRLGEQAVKLSAREYLRLGF